MKNFWQKMPTTRPFFALAPMANVTDSAFRAIIAKYGKPDVVWTEFVSADGLCLAAGRKKLLVDLDFSAKERPVVAQLFGAHPDKMREAAALVAKLKFDGLDINMGCPDRAVEKQGGGAAMIKDPKLAIAILSAAREGVSSPNRRMRVIPVSVKTRIGYSKVDWSWIRLMLEQKLPALTVHLRTRKEMSDVPAHWELMPEIVRLRDEISPETLIIGNGDVGSVEEGCELARKTGCDGVMIGRGVFGKPWLFAGIDEMRAASAAAGEEKHLSAHPSKSGEKVATFTRMPGGGVYPPNIPGTYDGFSVISPTHEKMSVLTSAPSPEYRLKILVEHTKLFEKFFCRKKSKNGKSSQKQPQFKSFDVMKKHFKAYVSGWPACAGRDGAKELRVVLMGTTSAQEVKKIVGDYICRQCRG